MTLGLAPRQAGLFRTTAAYCGERVAPDSIYRILHRECFALFPMRCLPTCPAKWAGARSRR